MHPYRILLHPIAAKNLDSYRKDLQQQLAQPGDRLAEVLRHTPNLLDDRVGLLAALFATKEPQIFAESQIHGDGRDWTERELQLLGDCSVAVDVTVFDDGRHQHPNVHPEPFAATLLFVPGLLLRNDRRGTPADWNQVVVDGRIDPERYAAIYQRRLLPSLLHADAEAARRDQRAVLTMPGIGCGQFAGPFHGQLGALLQQALQRLLHRHAGKLTHTATVWFDPYNECTNERHDFGNVNLRVRPLMAGNQHLPQLCPPSQYAEAGDDFNDCRLFSLVAWDHVSWPGNDFYAGSRATDDGVKAAATSAIGVLTGVDGKYYPARHAYLPPAGYATWGSLVRQDKRALSVRDRVVLLP